MVSVSLLKGNVHAFVGRKVTLGLGLLLWDQIVPTLESRSVAVRLEWAGDLHYPG